MAKKITKGLGDEIEVIAEVLGVKKAFELFHEFTGIDCGCEQRKQKLNAKFPSFKDINCLDKYDYDILKDLFDNNLELTHTLKSNLNNIYINTFGINLELEGCPSCWRDYVANLKQVFDAYTEA